MKIVRASAEILYAHPDAVAFIERVARTCYKSEDKIGPGTGEAFVRGLVKRRHLAMLEHASMTVRFVVDRGVSHEIVRHRIASFAQESTRYCDYAGAKRGKEITVIAPCFWEPGSEAWSIWEAACLNAEASYFSLRANGEPPERARSVLPNSLKTELVMTANMREWRTVFGLRMPNTAHPQMREVMIPLFESCFTATPTLFEDLHV
jgi:thymidylate synthase (FAD)